MNDKSLQEFAQEIIKAQTSKSVLIVDVRANPGGDSILMVPVIEAIADFQKRDPANKLYVIMGQRTFSAGGNFLRAMRAKTNAVYVGEATGASPNGFGETTKVLLPFAKVWFSVASDGPATMSQKLIPSFQPDWQTPLTANEYFSGRDPALEKILDREQIK